MGDLFSDLLRTGIVRVLFVPIVMGLIIYALWLLAAPPKDEEEDNHAQS
jgi:phage shock protein PspC (stress-responsive transcriptional regulator)